MTDIAIARALLEVLSDPKVAWRNQPAQALIDAVAKRAGEIDGTILTDAQGKFNLVDEYLYCRAQMQAVWNFLSPNASNDMDWADEIIIAIQNRDAAALESAQARITPEMVAALESSSDLLGRMKKVERRAEDFIREHGAQAVAWQVRRTDPFGKGFGWEFVTSEAFELTKRTGRYYGFADGMACEVRALYTAQPSLGGEDAALREDAARLQFLIANEFVMHRLRDTGRFVLMTRSGHLVTDEAFSTPAAAIDAARAAEGGERG